MIRIKNLIKWIKEINESLDLSGKCSIKEGENNMRKFDFGNFKKENIAVEVLNDEECREFLIECEKNNMSWGWGGEKATSFTPCTPTAIAYNFDKELNSKLGYSRSEFFSEEGYKVVKWSDIKKGNSKEEIIIYKNDREVVALHKENGKTVKSAKAICCPEDKFSFNVGAKLAFDRLTNSKTSRHEHLSFNVGEFVKVKDCSEVRHYFPIGSTVEIKEVFENHLNCYGYTKGSETQCFCNQTISMKDVMKISK